MARDSRNFTVAYVAVVAAVVVILVFSARTCGLHKLPF